MDIKQHLHLILLIIGHQQQEQQRTITAVEGIGVSSNNSRRGV